MLTGLLLLLLLHYSIEKNSPLILICCSFVFVLVYIVLDHGINPDFILLDIAIKYKIFMKIFFKILYFRIISYPAYHFHMGENAYLFIFLLLIINFILLYIIYTLCNNITKVSPYTGLFLSIFFSVILLIIFNFLFG